MRIQSNSSWILLNVALVVLFGVGVVLFVVMFPGVHIKWFLLAAITVLTFAVIIGINRQLWNMPMFWAAIAAFCVLHLGGYASLFSHVEKWPGPLFVAVFVAEVVVLNVAVAVLFPRQAR